MPGADVVLRRIVRLATIGAAAAAPWTLVSAQGIRIRATTVLQGVELRPLVEDSIPASQTSGSGPYRTTASGIVVRCVGDEPWCRFRRSGAPESALPLTQDIRAAIWGAGEGLSFHAHLRARSSLGANSLPWPRSRDRFDAIEAFLQLQRTGSRLRLGRVWLSSGLGNYNIDGAALSLQRGTLQVEGFAGASLVAGVNEPHTGATLGALDDLPPDRRGYTFGVRATSRWKTARAGGAYQRVIQADRSGLYSERAALDASLLLGRTTLTTDLTYDLIAGKANEAVLTARRSFGSRLAAYGMLRYYRPYFETWTIWGAFSPVGFEEWRAAAFWNDSRRGYALELRGGQRRYGATEAGLEYLPLRNDGWRLGVSARMTRGTLTLSGEYDADIGFGASSSDAIVAFLWNPSDRWHLGLTGSSLQKIYEFRLGTSRVLGIGLDLGLALSDETWLRLDAGVYRHLLPREAAGSDWSQRRATLRLEWSLGRDPGRTGARGP